MIVYGNKDNFDKFIKGNVLVEFYTTWCAPCKMMESELEGVSDVIDIIKIDAEENREMAKKYGIMSVPTLIYFKDGNMDIKKGFMNKEDILKWIEGR